jgi:uncharacterized protein (DUF305 family)
MNSKNVLAVTLTTGLFFFTSCGNGSSTSTDKDTTETASSGSMNSDTMDKKMNMDDMNKSGDDLMGAMNSSMTKMSSMKMSGDFDMDFANMLIEHHQGAIDMSKIEVAKGSDEKMKAMAQNIITKQSEEQSRLKEIVSSSKPSSMKMGEGEMEKSMSGMMNKMKSMQMSGNVDKDFATMMLSHHEDGISMAKMESKNGMNSKLKQMAQKGITDQQKEISEFKSWLSSNK